MKGWIVQKIKEQIRVVFLDKNTGDFVPQKIESIRMEHHLWNSHSCTLDVITVGPSLKIEKLDEWIEHPFFATQPFDAIPLINTLSNGMERRRIAFIIFVKIGSDRIQLKVNLLYLRSMNHIGHFLPELVHFVGWKYNQEKFIHHQADPSINWHPFIMKYCKIAIHYSSMK
jgi:hypothetical protein